MSKTFIAELGPSQEVASLFAVEEKQLRVAKTGNPFLTLKLVDKSGQIAGRIWERAEEWSDAIALHSVVLVRGRTELYRDELQLQISEISPVPLDQIDRTDFLPACPRNREELLQELRELAFSVKKGPLQRLLRQVLSDGQLMERFMTAPAAKSMHHAYLGGLLEHSLAVAQLVSRLAAFYSDLNRDLLVTGAILHDIGKIEEFVYDLTIDYSIPGRLVGHIVLGVEILQEKIRSLRYFPPEEGLLLRHLILSHHGETELGAVKLPMTREAFVLHLADDLDAKMNSINRIISEAKMAETPWTPYQPLFERFFFRGFPASGEADPPAVPDRSKEQGVQLHLWSPNKEHDGKA